MAQHPQQRRPGGGGQGGQGGQAQDREFDSYLEREINLAEPGVALFDTVAETIAKQLRQGSSNKTAQVRRFYDDMLRFRAAARADKSDEAFGKLLPHIRMLNAKAAYASQRKGEGGNLVDESFRAFLRTMLGQVKDRQTLENACTLFEAVIGFSPKN